MGAAEVPQGRRRPGGSRGVSREWTAALALVLAFGGVASAQQAISTGTISGVVHDEQGLPIPGALVERGDTIGGSDPVRISLVDGCKPILSRGERSEERFFDTSCFFRTPVGSYGNSPLNNIRQPGNTNVDLSMSKTFPIGSHGHRLQFRADAYNAFRVTTRTVNVAAQYDPLGNQLTSDFGRLALPTDEARQIELSLKYSF
jgi:hypothetical protein